ncbi:MAG: hypothetical protein MUF87_20925 [Anaerolineae bacterium]|jgi:hypothetical protein|nr:hypothetical protein [Anaerolineae bacterium]
MPYTVAWFIEDRVLLVQLIGNVTVSELDAMSNETTRYAKQGYSPVHAIADCTRLERMPTSLRLLMQTLNRGKDRDTGITVNVGASRVTRFMSHVIHTALGLETFSVDTIAEAEQLLLSLDPTLLEAKVH